jgi:ABC-type uncharacterized transport system substrate-binding protein
MLDIERREFIALVAGGAPLLTAKVRRAWGQQPAMPVVAFVNAGSFDAPLAAAFRKGLNEAGYFEGQNATVEYHWLEGHFDRLPALLADIARRRVAVIATPAGNYAAQIAKAATTTIPSTRSEIEAAFATIVRDRAEALYVAGDAFFTSRRVQLATLAASYRIPASYPSREAVEASGLMGYATDRADMFRQVGVYTGQIFNGARLPTCRSCSRPNSSS